MEIVSIDIIIAIKVSAFLVNYPFHRLNIFLRKRKNEIVVFKSLNPQELEDINK